MQAILELLSKINDLISFASNTYIETTICVDFYHYIRQLNNYQYFCQVDDFATLKPFSITITFISDKLCELIRLYKTFRLIENHKDINVLVKRFN